MRRGACHPSPAPHVPITPQPGNEPASGLIFPTLSDLLIAPQVKKPAVILLPPRKDSNPSASRAAQVLFAMQLLNEPLPHKVVT